MFLLVLAHPGSPRQRAVKRWLLLLLLLRDEADCSMLQNDLDKLISWAVANALQRLKMQGYACRKTEGQLFLLHGRHEINRGDNRKRSRSLDFIRHEVF